MAMRALKGAHVEAVAIHNVSHSGGNQEMRIAIRQRSQGDARRAIHAIFAALMPIKHVFVVDEDVDVFDDHQVDWALSTRFQADKDLVLVDGLPGMRMDPSLEGRPWQSKAGFDCTVRFGRKQTVDLRRPQAAVFEGKRKVATVREALANGPLYFAEIMNALGSLDGREVACEIDALRQEGLLCRNADGQYFLGEGIKGMTRVPDGHVGH
jgi:3-polyprenyl-4-hydroxybenzoate decarboxylase